MPHGESDEKDRDQERKFRKAKMLEAAQNMAGEAGGAGLGSFMPTPFGNSLVSHVSAAALSGVITIATAKFRRGEHNAAKVLQSAADLTDEDIEDLVDRITSSERLMNLTAHALNSAAATDLEAKIRLLARFVADGVLANDDARLDQAFLFTQAAEELDRPHIEVLEFLLMYPYPENSSINFDTALEHGWAREVPLSNIQHGLSRFGDGLVFVLATLLRNGLVEETDDGAKFALGEIDKLKHDPKAALRRNSSHRNPQHSYNITKFGFAMLRHLQDTRAQETNATATTDEEMASAGNSDNNE
jgi:hypothetical protein